LHQFAHVLASWFFQVALRACLNAKQLSDIE
jgi:hypothetical protein